MIYPSHRLSVPVVCQIYSIKSPVILNQYSIPLDRKPLRDKSIVRLSDIKINIIITSNNNTETKKLFFSVIKHNPVKIKNKHPNFLLFEIFKNANPISYVISKIFMAKYINISILIIRKRFLQSYR